MALREDLPAHGLVAGDIGTIVLGHRGGEGYEVEFVDADGRTLAVETLDARQIASVRGAKFCTCGPLSTA